MPKALRACLSRRPTGKATTTRQGGHCEDAGQVDTIPQRIQAVPWRKSQLCPNHTVLRCALLVEGSSRHPTCPLFF